MQIVIVGAGIAGLVAAHELLEKDPGIRLTVVERSSRVGGLIHTERTPRGHVLEYGPDSLVTFKPAALDQVSKVGLQDDLLSPHPGRGSFVVDRGRFLPLPDGLIGMAPGSAWAMMRSPLFSTGAKFRMAFEPWIPRRRSQSDESVADFVRRRFGQQVLDRLVDPLVGGVYRTPADELSAEAALPQLVKMEREHGSIAKAMAKSATPPRRGVPSTTRPSRPQKVTRTKAAAPIRTLRRGMLSLPERLAEKLGDRVQCGIEVKALQRQGAKFRLSLVRQRDGAQHTLVADRVILATPAWVAARLLEDLLPDAARELSSITHTSVCSVTMSWPRSQVPHPLDGAGFVTAGGSGSPLSASTWSSEKWPDRAPAGEALIRCYLRPHRVEGASDEECERLARDELSALLGIDAAPSLVRVHRLARALPQYTVGHFARVTRLREAMAGQGLLLAGNSYDGVGVPDCVANAQRAAEACLPAPRTTRKPT